jgi:hypothetical protein
VDKGRFDCPNVDGFVASAGGDIKESTNPARIPARSATWNSAEAPVNDRELIGSTLIGCGEQQTMSGWRRPRSADTSAAAGGSTRERQHGCWFPRLSGLTRLTHESGLINNLASSSEGNPGGARFDSFLAVSHSSGPGGHSRRDRLRRWHWAVSADADRLLLGQTASYRGLATTIHR